MNMDQAPPEMEYSEVLELFKNEQVDSFVVEGTTLHLTCMSRSKTAPTR